jgi:hypothetical protein
MAATLRPGDAELMKLCADSYYDPLGFSLGIYPWAQPGTSLANWDGPDVWQATVARDIGEHMQAVATGQIRAGGTQIAVGSGHGVGKSAFLAGVIIPWFLATRTNPQIVVTAGTDVQLRTKLWREVSKWHQRSYIRHWFDWRATSFSLIGEGVRWAANAIPWSRNNPAAFQGTHEEAGNVLVIFDEASAIDNSIWEAVEGAFTTPGNLWICFGNRTAAIGRFNDCFGKFAKRWLTYTIDSREAKASRANLAKYEEWVEDYGEDSDFVRVRVRGLPPKQSDTGLISPSLVEEAVNRDIREHLLPYTIPKVCGIDVGGGGSGKTVLTFRRGPLVRPQDIHKFSEGNHMKVADKIGAIVARERPAVAFIDAHGIGKGVYDRLVQLNFSNIVPIYSGDRSRVLEDKVYYNPRAEMWGRMAKWLTESKIPDDPDLREQLYGQPSDYDMQHRLKLMSKEDMREIGLPSPDEGDSLALTFAQTVAPVSAGHRVGSGLPEVG